MAWWLDTEHKPSQKLSNQINHFEDWSLLSCFKTVHSQRKTTKKNDLFSFNSRVTVPVQQEQNSRTFQRLMILLWPALVQGGSYCIGLKKIGSTLFLWNRKLMHIFLNQLSFEVLQDSVAAILDSQSVGWGKCMYSWVCLGKFLLQLKM